MQVSYADALRRGDLIHDSASQLREMRVCTNSGTWSRIGVTYSAMLLPLLASYLFVLSGLVTALQTTPKVATVNAPAALSPAEVSDLQKRADSGEADAQFALGKAYDSGNGVPQRGDQAAAWYRKAAEQGNKSAQTSLGLLYWYGNGVTTDRAEAVRWYRKAARQGDGTAMFNLGAPITTVRASPKATS